jgi:hypothetical protein
MALLEKQLVVKRSTLPRAGKGLFTKKFIPKGPGSLNTKEELQPGRKYLKMVFNRYIFYVKKNHVIDAEQYKAQSQGMRTMPAD